MYKRRIPQHLIQASQSLYQNTSILINTEEVEFNQGVGQGCGLSPTLFNIYTNDIICTWKSLITNDIFMNMFINVIAQDFADDQIIIQSNEVYLQKFTYLLHKFFL